MPKSGEVKCVGCSKFFLIRGIQTHLRHQPKCEAKFSKKALNDLNELCEAQKKKNISERKAKSYQSVKLKEKNLVILCILEIFENYLN